MPETLMTMLGVSFAKDFSHHSTEGELQTVERDLFNFFLISYQLFFPQQIVGQAAHKEREGRKPFCESFV